MYFQVSIPLPLIYDFVNTLDRDDTLARLKKFRKWDVSKRLVNGPCFQQMIVDREFEPGSFGEAFKNWSNKASNKAVDLFKPRDPNDIIQKLKGSTKSFHIYTFGGLKETNKWLMENNYA